MLLNNINKVTYLEKKELYVFFSYLWYLCANFSLHRSLCSRLMPDVRDRRQMRINT